MSNLKKKFILAMIFIVALGVMTGCSVENKSDEKEVTQEKTPEETTKADTEKTETTSVKIGFVSADGSDKMGDTIGYAKDQGYVDEELEKIGVTVEWVPIIGGGPAINEALASKDLDFGKLGDIPGIIGKASGIDTRVIAIGNSNKADILVKPDSDIQSVADLKGKKVATAKGQYMHAILTEALKEEGLTLDDIEFVNLAAQDAANALLSDNVDAICIGSESEAKLVLNGEARVVGGTQVNPDNYALSFLEVRSEFAKENPKVVQAVVKAVLRAKKEYEADDSLSKKQWVNSGYSEEAYDFLHPANDYIATVEITDKSKQKTKNTIQFLKENEIIEENIDINLDEWFDNSYYEAAVKE